MDPTDRPRRDPNREPSDEAEIEHLDDLAGAEDAGDTIENWAAAHSGGYSEGIGISGKKPPEPRD